MFVKGAWPKNHSGLKSLNKEAISSSAIELWIYYRDSIDPVVKLVETKDLALPKELEGFSVTTQTLSLTLTHSLARIVRKTVDMKALVFYTYVLIVSA